MAGIEVMIHGEVAGALLELHLRANQEACDTYRLAISTKPQGNRADRPSVGWFDAKNTEQSIGGGK